MNFTLIIPSFNEYGNLQIIIPAVKNIANEIIVIDPDTNDGTRELCERNDIIFIKQTSKGKGNALVEAVKYANHEVICFFDADLATILLI